MRRAVLLTPWSFNTSSDFPSPPATVCKRYFFAVFVSTKYQYWLVLVPASSMAMESPFAAKALPDPLYELVSLYFRLVSIGSPIFVDLQVFRRHTVGKGPVLRAGVPVDAQSRAEEIGEHESKGSRQPAGK